MEHSAYKEMLSALLDGELSGAEREAALAHMETCADCRAYFDELTALRAALGGMEEFDAPEDFAAGVMARLRADGAAAIRRDGGATAQPHAERVPAAPNPVKKRAAWRGYAALAACAAVVLLAVYALPDALRMGGSSGAAADSIASGSAVHASPSAAPASPAGDSAANSGPAAAPQAPGPGYNYTYAGKESGAEDALLESARDDRGRAADADLPAAISDNAVDGVANGAASGTVIVTTSGERYAAEDEKLSIADADETPMEPPSTPEAVSGEEPPVLTLSGAGAETWLAEHGWQGESGSWYADAAMLRALPDGLAVLDGELPEDYDGAVRVELEEVEP